MCASRLLRRSGVACGLVADVLNWRADLVIQVGIGQYHHEVDVLREEWPGVEFIGCEPCPSNAENYPGKVCNVAISDYVGNGTLYVKRRHKDGSSMFLLDKSSIHREISVAVTTLDALFSDPVDGRVLLWLDCEGCELDALRGGKSFLKNVDMVNVELTASPPIEQNPQGSNNWPSTRDVHTFLVGQGFYRQWVHTQRVSSGQCDGIYVRPELFNPEFACDPWEIERYEEWKTSN